MNRVLLAAALLATGCVSTARFVNVKPDGGVVAIPANSNSWPSYNRDAAAKLMAEKCPNGYAIVEEKEVVVGEEVRTASTASTSTRVSAPRTEYHIAFRSVVQVPAGGGIGRKAFQPTLEPMSPPPVPPPPPGLPSRPVPIN